LKPICTVILLAIVLLSNTQLLHAQEQITDSTYNVPATINKSSKKRRNTALNDYLSFPNINKIPYYYNKKQLKAIARLEKKQKYKKALTRLRKYVNQFGVQNFRKDAYLIWRLAQLNERMGAKDTAVQMYRLVLKHHRENSLTVKLYYDSLMQNRQDAFVPLDYYYQLVEYRKAVDTLVAPKSVLTNMGNKINSKDEDYGPMLTVNGNKLFFTSKRIKAGFAEVPDEDIFYSTDDYGNWEQAKPLRGLNTTFNEGSVCLSRDGKTIYFSRCNSPDSYGNCDLFTAKLSEDSVWVDVKNMGIMINSTSWDSHPSLSHSGDTLYFASDRMGGFGDSDIYFTVKNKKGEWQQARNLGPIINTKKNEVSPYYHPQFDVLYFSSDGHLVNFGDFDIFKSYRINGKWTEPKNIGPLVNSTGNEYYFTIDFDSKDLFYAKSDGKDKRNLDIYSFPVPMSAQALATTGLSGSIINPETGNPYHGIVSVIDLDSRIEVEPKFTRSDGSFEFDLIDKNSYLLVIQGDDFFRVEQLIYLDGDTEVEVEAKPIRKKWKFVSIEFEENSSNILDTMKADLTRVIKFLADNPEYKLIITGHTDQKGNPEANMKLSQDRAESIRSFILGGGGFNPSRVEAVGMGSTAPIFEVEVDEEQRKLNRRVEFQIVKIGELPDIESPAEDF
jgi:flagellar motor protein MotB